MREGVRAARLVFATAFRADSRAAALVVGLSMGGTLGTALMPLWLKLLADAVLREDVRRALLAALAVALSNSLLTFAGWITVNASQALRERTGLLLDERAVGLALGLPGVEHYERPEYLDRLTLLREDRWALGGSVEILLGMLTVLVQMLATTVLLASVDPLLLLLPAFGLAFLLTGRRAERLRRETTERTVERSRRAEHLFDLATDAGAGKELRVFGLGGELLGRHERLWRSVDQEQTRADLGGAVLDASSWLLFALGYAGAVVLSVWLAVRGEATAGDVLMTLGLIGQMHWYVQNVPGWVGFLTQALTAVGRLVWLEDYAAEGRAPDSGERLPPPPRIERAIEFEDVSFRYPGTDADVLSGVSLRLPAGSTIALVGENGAGKTTLVKLLTGVYAPSAGRILVDGVELGRMDLEGWRARTSAAFQDFVRWELLAREAVGIGDLPRIEEQEAADTALTRAGAEDLTATLPRGLETQLGRDWEGGAELSGGQWQKLALARAMMREAPLLLILDEPTASLDADAEHALFERYARATGLTAAESGTITVLVSHRFSTVRMADLIVVLDGGRVVEQGSHRELMQRDGLYSELYRLQSRAYR
jgi:ATP-binding cassette subfamily B protein